MRSMLKSTERETEKRHGSLRNLLHAISVNVINLEREQGSSPRLCSSETKDIWCRGTEHSWKEPCGFAIETRLHNGTADLQRLHLAFLQFLNICGINLCQSTLVKAMSLLFGENSTNGTVAWQPEPSTRGTWSILSSGVITTSLCLWTAFHLNIPPPNPENSQFWGRLYWPCTGLLASELVAYMAWRQRIVVVKGLKDIQEAIG